MLTYMPGSQLSAWRHMWTALLSLDDRETKIEAWRRLYNKGGPHPTLGDRKPHEPTSLAGVNRRRRGMTGAGKLTSNRQGNLGTVSGESRRREPWRQIGID